MGKQQVCSGLCQMTFAVTKSRESSRSRIFRGCNKSTFLPYHEFDELRAFCCVSLAGHSEAVKRHIHSFCLNDKSSIWKN